MLCASTLKAIDSLGSYPTKIRNIYLTAKTHLLVLYSMQQACRVANEINGEFTIEISITCRLAQSDLALF